MARRIALVVSLSVATLLGCEAADGSAGGPGDPGGAGVAGQGAAIGPTFPGTQSRLVELARIEGYGNPTTGELWSRLEAPSRAARASAGVAVNAQALSGSMPGYCGLMEHADGISGSNPADTFEYYTVDIDGTMTADPNDDSSFDPAECFNHLDAAQKAGSVGTTHMGLFSPSGSGVGCALQHLGNFYDRAFNHVYLDVDVFNGNLALQGPYGPPYTTGTVATPSGRNPPADTKGLWDFGMLAIAGAPGDEKEMWIYFKNGAPTDFTFTGSLVGEVVEDCGAGAGNGADEDCDGVPDNGCAAFGYGDPCYADDDCNNGTCIGETVTSEFGAEGDDLIHDVAGVCCSVTFDCGGVLSDTMSPALQTFSFNPTAIDTTSGSAMVTVSAGWTDDLSGTDYFVVQFRSPSSAQYRSCYDGDSPWTCVVTFPQYSEAGTWTVDYVQAGDMVGNTHTYYAPELQGLAFPTALEVTSVQDTMPPALQTFSFDPTTIDTTSGSAIVTVSAGWTDDIAGTDYFVVQFRSPSSAQYRSCYDGDSPWTCVVTFPQYSEAGTWTVDYVQAGDMVGNTQTYYASELQGLAFPTALEVTSVQDTMPPALETFSFSPTTIDTSSGSAIVTVSAGWTDDISGTDYFVAQFRSPSSAQYRSCYDGDSPWTCNVTFPQFSEGGTWTVDYVQAGDMVGNTQTYYAPELQGLAFPTALEVQ